MICDCFVPHTWESQYWIDTHEAYAVDWEARKYALAQYVGICKECHEVVHNGRLSMLLVEGSITEADVDRVMEKEKDYYPQ